MNTPGPATPAAPDTPETPVAPPPPGMPTAALNLKPDAAQGETADADPSDESTSRLQLIVDSVPGLMSYLDRDGRYLLVNRAYRAWFGDGMPFVGRTVAEVVGEASWQTARPHFLRALAGESVTHENVVRLHDGRTRFALASYTPHHARSGQVIGVVAQVTDVTAQKRADEDQRFLWRLSDQTQGLSDAAELVRTTARLLVQYLGVDRSAYAEVEDESVFNIIGDHAVGVRSIVGRWPVRDFGVACEEHMRTNQAYVVTHAATDPRLTSRDQPAYAATSIAAVICVPLHKEGRLTAAMAVHSATPRQWSAEEIDLVRLVVARCWESLERARATRQLLDSEAQYRTLFESLDEGFLLADVLRDEAGRAVDLRYLGANAAAIRMTGTDFTGRRLLEIDPAFEPHWLDIWGRVASTGRGERHRQHAAPLGKWFSFYVFPAGQRPDRVAVLFQDITGDKAREDELRASDWRHAFIVALSDALRPLADTESIERETTALLAAHLAVPRCFYVHFDEANDAGRILSDFAAAPSASIAGSYRIRDWPLNARLRLGQPVAIADVATDDRLDPGDRARFAGLGIRALVCVPLVKGQRLVAALAVAAGGPRAWAPHEVAMVQETADRTWAALERARAETALREADRRKDEFLATLAHELRNPLAPLRNGLQIARLSSRGDALQLRTMDMMDRQLSHLVRLVDDLLDVARINAGKIELRAEPVLLQSVLAASLELTRVLLEGRQQTVVLDIANEGLHVIGDADRLVQVLSNLLSNAAKYSDGPGRVDVRLHRHDDTALIQVADSGIGIPPAELGRVFDLFSQVRAHQARAGGGLGIGLSLVKSLVAQHGGSVSVTSAGTGLGSTFTVRLPLAPADRTPHGPAFPQALPQRQADRPRQVLVVDDNVDAAESLAALLEMSGHRVTVAHDGRQALAMAARAWPEIVFMDLGMPGMDGIETATCLRAEAAGRALLLVAMTGWGQPADQVRTAAAGFDHHLVKPADLDVIERLLADARAWPPVAGDAAD
jgi:PAS domain S-box-containing protein